MDHIDITRELDLFKSHLDMSQRTILSARFGDGKTYFLNAFKERYKSEYEFITLHPVNYAASRNEDIFEYIKRDIMLQIADWKEAYDFDVDLNTLFEKTFSRENVKPLVDFIYSCIPPHLAFAGKVIEKVKGVYDKYKESAKTLPSYNSSFTVQRGGIYEHDVFTELIGNAIRGVHGRVKEEQKPMKVMLLVEDLDRIDPGHLFRILNVLGAHIDEDANTNKFGIDNIVLVLDYGVTRKVFQHFYGEKANYEGYMTKFLSHQPFEYSILRSAHRKIYEYLEKECLLNHSVLGQPIDNAPGSTITLNSIVERLSVRQVVAALDGIDDMISHEPFDIHNSIYISPIAPVTKFIALIVRLGCSIRINDFIAALQHNNNPLNFFGGYLFNGLNLNCGAFKYLNGKYQTELKKDGNIVVSVLYVKSNLTPMDIEITSDYMRQTLTIAGEMVKDFHSRQIFK